MPSTYPQQLDVFPGAPYVDATEYLHASYANAWVSAITAVEQTLGVGAGSTTSNPLYSVALGTSFSNVAERIALLESVTGGVAPSNTLAASIAPVGEAAAAGSVGKTADAGHVHEGVTSISGGLGIMVSGGDGAGHGALTVSATPSMSAHAYVVTGPLTLTNGPELALPPFFEPVAANTSKTLVSVWYTLLAGTSVTFSVLHNGAGIANLTSVVADTNVLTAAPSAPVPVTNGDTFGINITSLAGAPAGLTVSFFFETGD